MNRTIDISFDLPKTRQSGAPVDQSEIRYVRLEFGLDRNPPLELATLIHLIPPRRTFSIGDQPPDRYRIRLTVYDQAETPQGVYETVYTIPADAPAEDLIGPVVNVQISHR